ncbi:MAG: phosphate acyltransferase [Candidatus Marinimicrobia bacterium]|jgi:phosphate butyryltransferase|nr:phosphate acyltransferase [Candidatus Neomarinimicrobiota bacterium]
MRYADIYKLINVEKPKTINVVFPNSKPIYEALKIATDKGFIKSRLYGIVENINKYASETSLNNFIIVKSDSPDEAIKNAIKDIRNGKGDVLMKGNIATASFLSPVLKRDTGLRKGELLSHVAVCDTPGYHKILFVTDGAINIDLNIDKRRALADNAIEFVKRIIKSPIKIAFAAIIEKLNEKIPETIEARILAEEFTKKGYLAEGPIALDVIYSSLAAKKKHIDSKISGDVDLIIGPNITTSNFLLKHMIHIDKADVGGIVMGAKVPLVLLSRSDDSRSKLNSIALSLV